MEKYRGRSSGTYNDRQRFGVEQCTGKTETRLVKRKKPVDDEENAKRGSTTTTTVR